ncbi:MAG: hypothetical protein ACREP6_04790, partial [Candidatus Binataceae bacterium]
MKHPLRFIGFVIFGAILAAIFCRGLFGLEHFGAFTGAYGLYFNRVTVASRHITNVSSAINFDYRAIDTVGEEYILFAAVLGTLILLRAMERERESEEEGEEEKDFGIREISAASDAVRFIGRLLTGLLVT